MKTDNAPIEPALTDCAQKSPDAHTEQSVLSVPRPMNLISDCTEQMPPVHGLESTPGKQKPLWKIQAARKPPTPYVRLAIVAAETERAGAYAFAAITWLAAAEVARRECNKNWALTRSAFCEKAKERGWGLPDEKMETKRHHND